MTLEGYDLTEASRVAGAIIATTAHKDATGVRQTRIREGEADPIKLIVAMADIQATTMEGSGRMLSDVARLYFEINPPASKQPAEHIEGMSKFMFNQLGFVSERLNSIHDDLRYYFSEETASEIEESTRREFRTHGLAVIHTAKDVRAAANQFADALAATIDSIPSTPLQASKLAKRALFKATKRFSRHE